MTRALADSPDSPDSPDSADSADSADSIESDLPATSDAGRRTLSSITGHRHYPIALLLVAAAAWASNWVIARGLADQIPPLTLAFFRWSVATLLIMPLAWPHLRGDWSTVRARWRALLLLGVPNTVAYGIIGYTALQYTTATNVALINGTTSIFTSSLAAIFLGTRITWRLAAAIVVALFGLALVVAQGDLRQILRLEFNPGDLLILLAVFIWAGYTVGLMKWRPPIHPLTFMWVVALIGTAVSLPGFAWELDQGRVIVLNAASIAGVLGIALIPTLLANICWSAAVPLAGPSLAGLTQSFIPVFGTVMSAVFLGERATAHQLLGITLIIGAVCLVSRRTG